MQPVVQPVVQRVVWQHVWFMQPDIQPFHPVYRLAAGCTTGWTNYANELSQRAQPSGPAVARASSSLMNHHTQATCKMTQSARIRPNVRLGNMWLFGRSSANIWRHLWLCICGVLQNSKTKWPNFTQLFACCMWLGPPLTTLQFYRWHILLSMIALLLLAYLYYLHADWRSRYCFRPCLSVCPQKISKTTSQKLMSLARNGERSKWLEVGDISPWPLTSRAIFVFFPLDLLIAKTQQLAFWYEGTWLDCGRHVWGSRSWCQGQVYATKKSSSA